MNSRIDEMAETFESRRADDPARCRLTVAPRAGLHMEAGCNSCATPWRGAAVRGRQPCSGRGADRVGRDRRQRTTGGFARESVIQAGMYSGSLRTRGTGRDLSPGPGARRRPHRRRWRLVPPHSPPRLGLVALGPTTRRNGLRARSAAGPGGGEIPCLFRERENRRSVSSRRGSTTGKFSTPCGTEDEPRGADRR